MVGFMNRIKKLTVFMLTFTVCVSSFCTAQCRAESVDAEKAEESVRLMTALGIFVPDRFDEYDSEKYMTRVEFSGVLAKLFRFGEKKDRQVFTDVPLGTENAGYIGTAYELGIFRGDGNGYFRPYDIVTYAEVEKAILYAAGYDNRIDELGAGKLRDFAHTDLTDGLTFENEAQMRRMDVAEIFNNALELCVMYSEKIVRSNGQTYAEMKKDKKNIVLTYFLKINKIEGIVTGNEYTSLYNNLGAPCGEGQVQIEGVNYKYDKADALIGQCVTAYISSEDSRDKQAYYITAYGNNKTLSLKYDKFSFNNGTLYDETGDKPKKIKLSDGATVIYNETYLGNFGTSSINNDTFDIKSGGILLIDNDSDGVYEVIRITEYETVFVGKTDSKADIVTDAYNLNTIRLDDFDKTEYFYKGKASNIHRITENSVLNLLKSSDKKLLRVYIADEYINGTITEKRSDDTGSYVKIGGSEYKISNSYNDLLKAENPIAKRLDVGVSGKYILSNDREIAAYISMTTESYGYVIAKAAENDGFSPAAKVKLFTENGRIEEFELSEKTSIIENGKSTSYSADKAIDRISQYKVIKYKLNNDRKLSKAEIPVYSLETSDKNFYQNVSKTSLQAQGNVLGAQYSVNVNTIVFNVPNPDLCDKSTVWDEKNYTIGATFGGGSNYTVDIYDTNEFCSAGLIVNYIGAEGRTPGGGYSTPMVVTDVSETLHNENTCLKITGYVAGTEKSVYVFDKNQGDCSATGNWAVWNVPGFKASDLKIGDVIQYTLANNEFIDQYRVLFRPNVQKDPIELYSDGTTVPNNIQRADMYTAFGKVLATDGRQVVYTIPEGKRKVIQIGSYINTYLIDMKKETVRTADKNEIHTGDDVFILLNYGGHYQTMIYRWE